MPLKLVLASANDIPELVQAVRARVRPEPGVENLARGSGQEGRRKAANGSMMRIGQVYIARYRGKLDCNAGAFNEEAMVDRREAFWREHEADIFEGDGG